MLCNLDLMRSVQRNDYKSRISIVERGFLSSEGIFCELLFQIGQLSAMEMELLRQLYRITKKEFYADVDYVFLIKVSTVTAMERIAERGRLGEQNITEGYQRLLDFYMTRFYHEVYPRSRVYFIDGEKPIDVVISEIESVLVKALAEEDRKNAEKAAKKINEERGDDE